MTDDAAAAAANAAGGRLPEDAPWSSHPAPGSDQTLELIARQTLFAGVPPDTLAVLARTCQVRRLMPGEVLLSPGAVNQTLYLLLDGRMQVHFDRVDSAEGFAIDPGESIGEISILDGQPATAYVVAEQPSDLLAIPESLLWDVCMQTETFARNFGRMIAQRSRTRSHAMQAMLAQKLRYEYLQKELAIAHDIQAGMLPHRLDLAAGLDIAAEMNPAREIGGDFYDAFPRSEDEYCFAIGDVSGKGIPAALFMVRTMTLLRSEMLRDQPIDAALHRLNAVLCEDNPTQMFATLAVGVLNRRNGQLRYVNAGHNPLILGTRGGSFRMLPRPRGILVGVDEGGSYEVATAALTPGDSLILCTDGVTEAMNPQQEPFTEQRLLDCLRDSPPGSAGETAGHVKDAIRSFVAGAPQSDDLTILVLRWCGC